MNALNFTYNNKSSTTEKLFFFGGEAIEKRDTADFFYVMNNHLGNVLTTVSDRKIPKDDGTYDANGVKLNSTPDNKIDYFTADITSTNDYGVWGDLLPQRHFGSAKYKYGMQGYEKDDEIRDITGSDYDFDGYGYDALTGRRKGQDPLANHYPSESPYTFAGNNPIYMIDKEGKRKTTYITTIEHGEKITTKVVDEKYTLPVTNIIRGIPNIPDEGTTEFSYTVNYNVVEFITIDVDQKKVYTTGEQPTNPAWQNDFEWLVDEKASRPGGNALVGKIDIPANDAKYLPTAKNPGKDIDVTLLFGGRGGANSLGGIIGNIKRFGQLSKDLGKIVDVFVKGFKAGQKIGEVFNMVKDAVNPPKVFCKDCERTFEKTSSGKAGKQIEDDKKTPKDTIDVNDSKHPDN